LVNEQAEVSLLLAAPGIVATYSLAPVVILLFYSSAFTPAVEVLRWQILGVLGQVITWPMGFILVAKNRSSLVFLTNFVFSIIHLVLFWFAIPVFGLAGTGMAFALVHVYQFVVLSKVCVSISGFRWSRSNKQLLLLMIASLLITVLTTWLLPHWLGILGGCIVATAFSCYSLQKLTSLAGVNSVAAYVTRRIKKLKTAKIPIGREG
jgi:PST family polysaccharide transporter